MTADIDRATAGDMVRAMALLRGFKARRNEPWTPQLQAIENAYRRCVMLDVVVRAAVDDCAARVEDRGMQTLWLTTKQGAETLQISEGLLRKRIRDGELRAVREGKGYRIRRTELERYVDAKKAQEPMSDQVEDAGSPGREPRLESSTAAADEAAAGDDAGAPIVVEAIGAPADPFFRGYATIDEMFDAYHAGREAVRTADLGEAMAIHAARDRSRSQWWADQVALGDSQFQGGPQ